MTTWPMVTVFRLREEGQITGLVGSHAKTPVAAGSRRRPQQAHTVTRIAAAAVPAGLAMRNGGRPAMAAVPERQQGKRGGGCAGAKH